MSVLAGNIVQSYAKFKNKSNVLVNPTTVQVKVKQPDLTETTYIYGVDPEVVRESTGIYYINLDTTGKSGTWYVKWNSLGTQGVAQTNFTVVDTDI